MKATFSEDCKQSIMDMLSDIINYFKQTNENKIMQGTIEMELIFRGMIVKNWYNIAETK